jgi:hypothetical protein
MSSVRVWSAAELEVLTPDERHSVLQAGFVTDPEGVSAQLLQRARAKSDARIAALEGPLRQP